MNYLNLFNLKYQKAFGLLWCINLEDHYNKLAERHRDTLLLHFTNDYDMEKMIFHQPKFVINI